MAKEKSHHRDLFIIGLETRTDLKDKAQSISLEVYITWKANKDQLTGQAKGKLSGLKSGKKTGLSTEETYRFFFLFILSYRVRETLNLVL